MPLSAHFGFDLASYIFSVFISNISIGEVTNASLKQEATNFLNRKDLRQKIRRELLFGLFPKTLKGKFTIAYNFPVLYFSDGQEQLHLVRNAFSFLVNQGFLREKQGVQTLEVVQKFFEIINEPIRKAKSIVKDLNSFCPAGKFTLDYQAVITLVYEDSHSNDKFYHAVWVPTIFCVVMSSHLTWN